MVVPDELTKRVFGNRPAGDRLARAIARARIAGELFEIERPVTLGRYHVIEILGTGGMGVVWVAWDPQLDRRVAIKVVTKPRESIVCEAQALARLSHPNVVTAYDIGTIDDDAIYLVMEWVPGKTLRAYCAEPRSIAEIVAVYREAGRGLAAAHRAGIVHRDFKPDNAVLGDDGRVRVLDFGLACPVAGDGSGEREQTDRSGTPRYMAPEQTDGAAVTTATDQYALCVSLREALVGRHGDGTAADVPRWLGDIIACGTQTAAADRFPSMTALVGALDERFIEPPSRSRVSLGVAGRRPTATATRAGRTGTCAAAGARPRPARQRSPRSHSG